MAGAQRVGIAVMAQAEEGGARLRPGEGVALPPRRVVTVDILRDDIEVATKHHRHFTVQKGGGTGAQPVHPGDLVIEFRSGGRVAIGKIDGGDANAADRSLHIAGLLVRVIAGKSGHHIFQRQPCGDGDAVIAFLPVEGDVPA